MDDFLSIPEHCQCILDWLLKLAHADNRFTSEEEQLIKGLATTLNISSIEYKNVLREELSREEVLFTLREMYRLSIADGVLSNEEQDVLNSFVSEYNISSEILEATKQWFEAIQRCEQDYRNAIQKVLSL
jgi:hypothetical protein